MCSNVIFGYGCRLGDLDLYDFWEERLVEALPYDLREELDAAWADVKEEYRSKGWTVVQFWTDYIRAYDNGHGDFGLEALLAAAINEAEFGGRRIFTGRDGKLLALPRFPRKECDREVLPLEDALSGAVHKWLKVIARNGRQLPVGYEYFD